MHTQDNTPNTPDTITVKDYERVLLQAAVLKQLYARHAELKDMIQAQLTPGDKRAVKNAQGLTLGSVSMSAPNKKAVCNDPAVLLGMAQDKGLEIIDALPQPADPRYQEIVDFLYETRPDLLDSGVSRDDEKELAEQVLSQWQITGQLPAGWEVVEASKPRFSVTPGRSKGAKAAIAYLTDQAGTILELEQGDK
ncbi:hypothetical protein HMPREF2998_03060 [Corynebacterium sp. HMSC065A05]|uniref:hypothetical protein n=1 Tax=Corynebacterium sp. HMSC065A05 TaxID=1739502 RepID=UPI0008A4CA42|nr:hypothetical protein [Corynebacterium sp. HMSC065A05]OFP17185.1 hypothetical protein HMPREF2998_03060 [Corynebacterium sp. HMSC065A05]